MNKTTDFKRLSEKECARRLLEIKNPVVLMHVRPDGDAVGSAAALALIFDMLGSPAKILSADKITERLKFILDYTGVRLADKNEAKALDGVAIDVASPAQLGELYDAERKPLLMIDHHAVGEQFADAYTVPQASSAAEALFDVIEELIKIKKITLDEKLSFALYAAISSDTGRFSYSNTTPKTHRIAARLMETGIDTSEINRALFDSKSPEQLRAEGFIASKLSSLDDGKITYATLSSAELSELGIAAENFETAIDIIRSVRGAEISVFLRQIDENKYKASLRSVGQDVAAVAKRFGGGGHVRAAGCTVAADSIDLALEAVLKEIKALNKG